MHQKAYPILMYHSIADVPKDTIMRSLHVPPKRFILQMRLLKLIGYRAVSISELQHYIEGKKIGKVVGLTFDDGYRNNLINALPIIKKLGFSATIYIVSKNIGGINQWDIDKGLPAKKMMNEREINNWVDGGMEIGSHSQNHTKLTKCKTEIAFNEINQSKLDLEKKFNTPIHHFCYPYGNVNESIVSITKKAGYQTAVTTKRARATTSDNHLLLPRVKVTHHTLLHLFLLKILSNYEDKRRK